MYWPAKVTFLNKRELDPVTKEERNVRGKKKLIPLQDLRHETHIISKAKRKLGEANRGTVRFEAWDQQATIRDKATQHFMAASRVKRKAKVTAMRYRTGCLFTLHYITKTQDRQQGPKG